MFFTLEKHKLTKKKKRKAYLVEHGTDMVKVSYKSVKDKILDY